MNNPTTTDTTTLSNIQILDTNTYNRWISYLDVSPKSVQTYNRAIKQFAIYLMDRGITQPERIDIIEYREYLKVNHKPTTVQSYLAAVKLFFKWCESEKLYPNIAEHVKGAKLDAEHKKDNLTSKQVNRIFDKIDKSTLTGKRDYAMLFLMVTTGLRTISISKADIGDLRTSGNRTVLYYQGKGHEEKAIFVNIAEPVEDAIRDYLKTRGEKDSRKPLFSSISNRNVNGRMTTRSISRIAKNHFIDVGLNSDRITAHSLRHTAATINLLNGGTVEKTRDMLGHRDINTTLIYSHTLDMGNNDSPDIIAKAILSANS